FVTDDQGVGTIVDDEPQVSIDYYGPSVTEGNTGTTTANFTVRLSAGYAAGVTVDYTTLDGSALAGSDYQAAQGTLVIPKGQTVATIPFLVNGDKLAEYDESFSVQLSNPNGALLGSTWSYATILDDEPRLSIDLGPSVTEGNLGTTTANFKVRL